MENPKFKANCIVCGKEFDDYEPQYCCGGFECGCQGLPIEPPICSAECWDVLMKKGEKPIVIDSVEKLAEHLKNIPQFEPLYYDDIFIVRVEENENSQ